MGSGSGIVRRACPQHLGAELADVVALSEIYLIGGIEEESLAQEYVTDVPRAQTHIELQYNIFSHYAYTSRTERIIDDSRQLINFVLGSLRREK
jgi:hypothetical protein